jgi:hypothetical protein
LPIGLQTIGAGGGAKIQGKLPLMQYFRRFQISDFKLFFHLQQFEISDFNSMFFSPGENAVPKWLKKTRFRSTLLQAGINSND